MNAVIVSPDVATVIRYRRNCNKEWLFVERLAGWPEIWNKFYIGTKADSAACERDDWQSIQKSVKS